MTDIIDMGGDVVTVEPTVPAATEPIEAAQTNIPWWIIAVCIFGGAGWGVVIGIVLVPKGVLGNWESEGSWRQITGLTNRNHEG